MDNEVESDTMDLEAFKALDGTLQDVFFDPVKQELDDVRQTVMRRIQSTERKQSDNLGQVKSDLDTKLNRINASYVELNETLTALTASVDRAHRLLADEEDQSEIRNLAEDLQTTREALQSSIQAFKDVESEHHETRMRQHEEMRGFVKANTEAINKINNAVVKETSELEKRTQTVEHRQQWVLWVAVVATILIICAIGMSTWLLLSAIQPAG